MMDGQVPSISRRMAVEPEDDESISEASALSGSDPNVHGEASSARDDASVSSDEETLADLNNFPRISRKGTIWKRYKPIKQDTLYSKILTQTRDIKSIALELCSLFEEDSSKAIASLLQFCIDVFGFQRFDVINLYMADKDAQKTLNRFIKELLDDEEYLEAAEHTAERYLLMENSMLAKYLQLGIYTFLQEFVLMAHKKDLLYSEQTKLITFFDFVRYMSLSELRVICHTGTAFGVKIISALVKIYKMIENDEDMTMQKTSTLDLIQFLYLTFIKSLHFDKRAQSARVESCHELRIWAKCLPKEFIDEWDVLNYIIKVIHDPSQSVRCMALRTVQKFLKDQDTARYLFQPNMEERTNKLIERIQGRFEDVDQNVVLEALRTFTILHEVSGDRCVNLDKFEAIIKMIFVNIFVIGQAACEFTYKFISRSVEGAADKVLNSLALIISRHPFGTELLVEGCLPIVPEIKNWSLYIRLLSENGVLLDSKKVAKLFAEAVTQVLKGCSSKLRKGSPTVDVDPKEHNIIAQHFPGLVNLISNFWEEEAILTDIFKIFSVAKPTDNHVKDYVLLCNLIEQLFADTVDEQLLHEIVSTLNNLCDNFHFCDRAKFVKRTVVEKYSEQFCTFLREPAMENAVVVAKAKVLYQDGKLTDEITWSLLCNADLISEAQIFPDLLICCKMHLIWALKELKEIKANTTIAKKKSYHLLQSVQEYSDLLFSYLRDLDATTLRLKVYHCLCEFYTSWNDALRPLIRFDQHYEMLLLRRERKMDTIVVPFLDEYIIKSKEMPLRDRQKGVIAFVEMVNNGTIPLSSVVHVYKYYNEYFLDYGLIIEASLKGFWEMDDKHNFYSVITITIGTVYQAIIEKYGVIDMKISEVTALKALTKRLLAIEPFRKPNKDFLKLVMLTMYYSIRTAKNLNFLFFARYFLVLIADTSDLEYMLNKLTERLSEAQKKSDAVLCFMTFMRQVKQTKLSKAASSSFASPGKPVTESTPKSSTDAQKGKATASTSANRSRKTRLSKETPNRKKVSRASRPLYSKMSEGAIEIQDDSDSNPEQN